MSLLGRFFQRKKNLSAGARTEQLLSDVLNRIDEGFLMVDRNFVYTYVNPKVAKMVGRRPEDMVGKNMWELFPEAVGTATYQQMQEAMRDKKFVFGVDHYAPLNLWQENYIYPAEKGLSVFIRDVSEMKAIELKTKQTESIYKAIASNIPGSVICIFDREYRYLLAEGDLIEKFGYDKNLLKGKKIQDVADAERLKFILPNLEKAFRGETVVAETGVNDFTMQYRYVPLKDERDKIFSVMLAGFDISELKNAQKEVEIHSALLEKKVEERTRQLEEINRELESFSYSIAHDLTTPVRALSGYCDMLAESLGEEIGEDSKKFIGRISFNAQKMARLIENLLAFSNLGRKEVKAGVINTSELLNECLSELATAGVKIETGTLHNTYGDRDLIGVVWTNLLSNAIKYSAKSPQPRIEIGSEKDENGMVTFRVSDNGVGFDMNMYGRLFGVFQRLHREEDFPGNGIGLASAARIVHKHGGRIWAEGARNGGASFYFSLPHAD